MWWGTSSRKGVKNTTKGEKSFTTLSLKLWKIGQNYKFALLFNKNFWKFLMRPGGLRPRNPRRGDPPTSLWPTTKEFPRPLRPPDHGNVCCPPVNAKLIHTILEQFPTAGHDCRRGSDLAGRCLTFCCSAPECVRDFRIYFLKIISWFMSQRMNAQKFLKEILVAILDKRKWASK